MTDKTIYTLKLGGNDVTLKLRNGALRKFKELSGKDPLELLSGGDTIDRIYFAETIVKAGMLAHEPKVDVSKVGEWIDDVGTEEVVEIINAFGKAFTPDEKKPSASPEGSQNTQQSADAGTTVQ